MSLQGVIPLPGLSRTQQAVWGSVGLEMGDTLVFLHKADADAHSSLKTAFQDCFSPLLTPPLERHWSCILHSTWGIRTGIRRGFLSADKQTIPQILCGEPKHFKKKIKIPQENRISAILSGAMKQPLCRMWLVFRIAIHSNSLRTHRH